MPKALSHESCMMGPACLPSSSGMPCWELQALFELWPERDVCGARNVPARRRADLVFQSLPMGMDVFWRFGLVALIVSPYRCIAQTVTLFADWPPCRFGLWSPVRASHVHSSTTSYFFFLFREDNLISSFFSGCVNFNQTSALVQTLSGGSKN